MVPVETLFLTWDWLVCIKPAGLSSERGGLPELMEKQHGGTVFCVHRLDQAVGGLMLYARSAVCASRLSAQIAGHEMKKEYLAVVEGRPEAPEGTLRDLLYHDVKKNKSYVVKRERRGVREALLDYRVLACAEEEQGLLSLVRIRLHTGRSHQIRVQFASRALPLVGDRRYGSRSAAGPIALWSAALAFRDPESGIQQHFEAPPPPSWPWTAFSPEAMKIGGIIR